MKISIESNLAELNRSIQQYAVLSGKTLEGALKKQAAKLGFMLKQELKGIAPAKGSIRQELLSRLKSGLGVRVSPGVLRRVYQSSSARSSLGTRQVVFGKSKKGKASVVRGGSRLNLWAMAVKAEIASRESASGFLGVSATYPHMDPSFRTPAKALSKYGPVLSEAGFKADPAGGSIEFAWGPASQLSGEAAEGINKPKGDAAIDRALKNTAEDIEEYITRKLDEAWK